MNIALIPNRPRVVIVGHGGTGRLGVLPAAIAAAAPIAAKIPAVAKLAEKLAPISKSIKNIANKIGIGGVTQKRFFERYFSIRDAFIDAGYLKLNTPFHENALTQFKIRKTQVKDKGDNYTAEFERLHKWVDYVLNNSNPGLGDDYRKLFPTFKMANQGNMYGAPITALKEILAVFKPGTYTPGTLQVAVANYEAAGGANQPAGGESFLNMLEDTANEITSYSQADSAVNTPPAPGTPNANAAGTSTTVIGMTLGIAAIAGLAYFNKKGG